MVRVRVASGVIGRERAEATAAQVAKKFGIDARTIFIRLNLDFKNPSRFESTDFVMGYQAYYLAWQWLAGSYLIKQDQKAGIHFLLKDDSVLNVMSNWCPSSRMPPLHFWGTMVLVRARGKNGRMLPHHCARRRCFL